MWAFALPLWDYVLVGFCPTGFCPDTVYSIGGFERALPPKNAVKSPISPTHYENANEAGLYQLLIRHLVQLELIKQRWQ